MIFEMFLAGAIGVGFVIIKALTFLIENEKAIAAHKHEMRKATPMTEIERLQRDLMIERRKPYTTSKARTLEMKLNAIHEAKHVDNI